MAIYGIYACESTYGGLHGMNNYGFEECDNDEMANEVGIEWSYNVMDSYESIGNGFEEDAAAALGNYSVTIGTESTPSIVVDDAITSIQEVGYKTNRKAKALTVLWDKATEPAE